MNEWPPGSLQGLLYYAGGPFYTNSPGEKERGKRREKERKRKRKKEKGKEEKRRRLIIIKG